jgi:hypothetical protein
LSLVTLTDTNTGPPHQAMIVAGTSSCVGAG